MDDLRYPIGRYQHEGAITPAQREVWLADLAAAPTALEQAVAGLNGAQLDTPYRPDGWTVRQVVHHLPESHMNSYIRCKWALTEDAPTIKTYAEDLWAKQADSLATPIEPSLALFQALHVRWLYLLRTLTDEDFLRTFRYPGGREVNLAVVLGIYAWHGRHHIAHITALRERMGWN